MITAYRKLPRPHHDVAAVGPDLRAHYPDGTTRHVHHRRPGCLYYMRMDHAVDLNRRRLLGHVRRYDGRPYEWTYRGETVYLVRGLPRDAETAALALGTWRDWVESYGAEVAGMRRTSRSLLRATLRRSVPMPAAGGPPLPEVIGGRVECYVPAGEYERVLGVDMQAAYARTLGELCWRGWWSEVARPALYRSDPGFPVFHDAEVRVPDLAGLGPLPVRQAAPAGRVERWWGQIARDYPTGATLRGIYADHELREALRHACDVTVHRTWIMAGEDQPFLPWWRAIVQGRDLPHGAGRLAKLTGNVLWGSFLAGGGLRTETYADGPTLRERTLPLAGTLGMPTDLALAESVTSWVRTRLLADVIRPNRHRVLSVHTDGAILSGHRMPAGLAALGWRVKYRAPRLVFVGPQTYARTDREHPRTWHYVVGGIPELSVPDVFWPMAREAITGPRRWRHVS